MQTVDREFEMGLYKDIYMLDLSGNKIFKNYIGDKMIKCENHSKE